MTGATAAPLVARTTSPAATRDLAAAVASVLVPGDLLLLVGELGAGKTTFTQGLARGLGVTGPVTSPTFTLVRAYPCAAGAGGVATLYHADLYRLDRLGDVVDLGLAEMVEDDAAAVVEWGDAVREVFGPDVLEVALAAPPRATTAPDPGTVGRDGADEPRTVTIVAGGSFAPRAGALAAALEPWTRSAGDDPAAAAATRRS